MAHMTPLLNHGRPALLRRRADEVERQAARSTSPTRALELARRMRMRAAELECDRHDDFEGAAQIINRAIRTGSL